MAHLFPGSFSIATHSGADWSIDDLKALLPLIPFLRRQARLLTGSKDVGDEYVRLCLELVTAQPERLEGGELRV